MQEYLELIGGSLPDEAGSKSGRCVVVGDARCVWDDLKALGYDSPEARGMVKGPDFMCVNMIGLHFPGPFRHWYSNDAKWLAKLAEARRPEFYRMWSEAVTLHTNHDARGMVVWPWHGPGTSGLNATLTAVALGYDEVVLCGIPLDDSGHNGEPPWRSTNFIREAAGTEDRDENRFWKAARRHAFAGRVKSMSGRTKDWLGSP